MFSASLLVFKLKCIQDTRRGVWQGCMCILGALGPGSYAPLVAHGLGTADPCAWLLESIKYTQSTAHKNLRGDAVGALFGM